MTVEIKTIYRHREARSAVAIQAGPSAGIVR